MLHQRFSTGAQFTWHGAMYEVLRYLPDLQSVSVENLNTGFCESFPLQSLVEALFADELQFVTKKRYNTKKETSSSLPEEMHIALDDYPQHLVDIAKFRMKVIEPLFELSPSERSHDTVAARVKEVKITSPDKKVSVRSIYRWIKDWEMSGGDLRALIPNYSRCGGRGKSRLDIVLQNIIDAVIKENITRREKITVDQICYLVAARIDEENQLRNATERLQVPARSTITRRIEALDIRDRIAWKRGRSAVAKLSKQVNKLDAPQLPLERVEFDHTKTDIIVIDEKDNLPLGRLTLSYMIDVATRYPLGFYLGFEPPSYYTVMETLYHAIAPKPDVQKLYGTQHSWIAYGIPNMLVVDNGKELVGNDLSDACQLLGINLNNAPVKTPEYKGTVERAFRTFNTGLFHTLPGTTFSNYIQRGDYDSVKYACMSLDELVKALHIFTVDIYAERHHKGLNGVPARRWGYALETNFCPRLPKDRDTLRILLGRVDYRTIQRYGIDFHRIRYNCNELASLRLRHADKKVKIKYHPGDLSRIYVFDPYENQYIETPALDQEYTEGLSLWKHKVIMAYARQLNDDVDLAALGRAMKKIQEIVDDARNRVKTTKRSKIARWENSGNPPSLENTHLSREQPKLLTAGDPLGQAKRMMDVDRTPINIDIPEFSDDDQGWEIFPG